VLGQYLAWSGDKETVRGLLPAARSALEWLGRYADLDSDGFVEYVTRSPAGVKNQGWLDSGDAVVDEDGRIVENPIATSELQAYVYAGLGQAAAALTVLGDVAGATDLIGRANDLRARFHDAFWVEREGTYASALGPDKRPIASVASNAGHVLAAGIVPHASASRVARRLMQPDMFSGWGIRTLSSEHPAFDPFSYHRGSVWPVEQATIAFGFARYACWAELERLAEGFFDTTALFASHRLPEVIGGVARDAEHGHPGVYPGAHEPQGWSASAVLLIVQSLLGMRAFAPARLLLLDPHLPAWLPDLRVEGLRLGRARIDLDFRRRRDGTTAIESRVHGKAIVLRQPVADPSGSLRARLGAGLQRFLPFIA
jgi:glycogen debranching enzyme